MRDPEKLTPEEERAIAVIELEYARRALAQLKFSLTRRPCSCSVARRARFFRSVLFMREHGAGCPVVSVDPATVLLLVRAHYDPPETY